jgi:hypothetical protein
MSDKPEIPKPKPPRKPIKRPRPTHGRSGGSININDMAGFIVTGDAITAAVPALVMPPPPGTIDPRAELAALRDALAGLQTAERGKLDRALQDAEEEAARPDLDRIEIARALRRVLKCARSADDFASQVQSVAPRIAALASWLGPAGRRILSLEGLGR